MKSPSPTKNLKQVEKLRTQSGRSQPRLAKDARARSPNGKLRKIFLSPPHIEAEEMRFVKEVFASNYISTVGPMVDAFEKEFAARVGIPYCVAVASGTAAIHLALRELGVGPGDEVLASTLTFIGSVSSVVYLGASLAFIDSDIETWNMNPDLLAEELAACARRGKLPKVVLPTDLYGQCVDLDRIKAVCEPYGIPVVVDAAESMGATYKGRSAGVGARAAAYSFNGNKIITTSGGGMLASEDKGFIEHARKLSQQSRDPAPHYEHSELGYNYRMSNVLAAIGRAQLRVLDKRVERKHRILATYRQLLGDLPGLDFMPESPQGLSNRWLTVVLINPGQFGATSEQVRLALEAENIESRPGFKPMHLQPVFKHCRIAGGSVSEFIFRYALCLPSGTAMTDADISRVAQIIRRCHRTDSKTQPRSPVAVPLERKRNGLRAHAA
jgi:dTDP-4-amino-4,6-dideoxygalactose transaminase